MGAENSPGRRLGEADEQRGAELFAAGASEREVADALACSASTAHRLRERLQAAQDGAERAAGMAAAGGPEITPVHPLCESDGELEQLQAERDRFAELVQVYQDRAAASRQALAALEAERIEVLTAGKDAAPLRPRRADAEADLADSETSEQIAAQRLAAVGQRIAEIEAARQLEQLRAELDAAVAERDAECARTGGRLRRAVLAVRQAAEEFTAALADEQGVIDRAGRLEQAVAAAAQALGQPGPSVKPPEGTGLWVDPGYVAGQPIALMRALASARNGNAEAVAKYLGEAFGWLPPDPAELAAEAERMRALFAEQDQAMRQPQPAAEPWTRPDTSSYGVDQNGREVRWYPGYRPPLPPHPLDAYRR